MRISNTQYASPPNTCQPSDTQCRYAICNTQHWSMLVCAPTHNTQYAIRNRTQTACFQGVHSRFCVSPVHNTQYAIRNVQSCSRQECVNTQQGASVRRQSIRSVNRIAHVSPRLKFIEMAKQFNADDIDDDVDSLPCKMSPGASSSTSAAATPSHDRPAASAPAAKKKRESEPHTRSA